MKNKYKQRTSYLGIPVVGKGDGIYPDVELRKYTIIENMLIAGTQGLKEVVFDDGSYALEMDGDTYMVKAKAASPTPSIHGMVSGFYFKCASVVKWEGLKKGFFYYLYVKATPDTPYKSSAVRMVSSTVRIGSGALLVATVDLREETPELEVYPDGKVYSQDVARHASDTTNPHGLKMTQSELEITDKLSLGKDSIVELDDKKVEPDDMVMALASLVGRKVLIVDFDSGGPQGVIVKVEGKVVNVQVSRRCSGRIDRLVGEVGVGYFPENDELDSEEEFVVYNTGEDGVPMRALVICG